VTSIASFRLIGPPPETALPRNVYRYVLATSAVHQFALVGLTVVVALLEVAPLEMQRRIVNDLVKHRPYSWVLWLCAAYAGVVLIQGSTKLVLNVYRGWVGERPSVTCVTGCTPLSSTPSPTLLLPRRKASRSR